MSAITFSVGFTGTPDEYDIAAAQYVIDAENARRAAQDPPESPLPDGSGAEIKSSYLGELGKAVDSAHANYAKAARTQSLETQVRQAWIDATDAQRAAALAALS